ncbi:cytochrome b [Campylobacter iguaniorum]|uniref:cytochrome b/b6 domain-containing protein n=1 Tax=Campylobacter iguaniorum TaxID=1244531 RepID=UPI0007C986F6|nr:cytochrome b/b6 domain-containing protein [Campylobacter iguaniorum]ANE35748.1 cytochrome b [Campylobacter iguaniorum]
MKINRQSIQNRVIHWGVALSIFGLIITGTFQMPIAKRYNITKLIEWSGDYIFTLNLHYIFAVLLIFFSFYHVVFHSLMGQFDIFPKKSDVKNSYLVIKAMITKGKEPPSEKYLPEQRLAYIAIALVIAMLIVTGIIKSYKNILQLDISNSLYFWAAQLHNLGMILIILLIIAHLLAFIPKENRNLLSSMFSGKVGAKYTLHRHSLWKDGVNEAKKSNLKDENE